MKKVFILFILIFCIKSNAQFYAGAKLGLNYANQFHTVINNSGFNSASIGTNTQMVFEGNGKFAPNFAFTGGILFKRFFALQTELAYMSMGYINDTYPDQNIRVDYIQWNPLMFRFLTGRRKKVQFFLSVGFSLGFPVYAKQAIGNTFVQDPNDPFRIVALGKVDVMKYTTSPDGSLIAGVGLSIPVGDGKLEIEGRYQGGFTNVYDYSEIHNSNLIIQVGYLMFIRKDKLEL